MILGCDSLIISAFDVYNPFEGSMSLICGLYVSCISQHESPHIRDIDPSNELYTSKAEIIKLSQPNIITDYQNKTTYI